MIGRKQPAAYALGGSVIVLRPVRVCYRGRHILILHLRESSAVGITRLYPGLVGIRLDNLNNDWHIAVILAAELCTLATKRPGFLGTEPGLVDDAGDRIFLYSEFWYPPGMIDVIRRQQQTHFLAFGYDEWPIDFTQIIIDAERIDTGLLWSSLDAGQRETRIELDTFILVF
jgi:hypothetical protein